MSEVCVNCGLPKELCVCETIAKESQTITVRIAQKKFGKVYTEIIGIDNKEIDIKDLAKKLKNKLACGGTVKNSVIELQGDHKTKLRELLVAAGFAPETIKIEGRTRL